MEIKFTRSLLALAVTSTVATPALSEVVISQYIEGSSYNKALEIANTGNTTVSLDNFQLAKSSNGGGSWDTKLPLTGRVIKAHDVLVLSHPSAGSEVQQKSHENNATVINFNGDDPVALLNSDGTVHDMLGEMGDVDWGKDVTLVRSDLTPSTGYQASQWVVLGKDDFSGLGLLDSVDVPEPFACTQDGSSPVFTSIQDIQGEGASSPFINGYPYITDEEYFVKGVVSAVTTGLTKGFYLSALNDDYNANTSEGLFVHTNLAQSDLIAGDVVCVKGKIQESYGLTQLKAENNNWIKLASQDAPQAVDITLLDSDENFEQTLERYEGMLVRTSEDLDMRVTRTFGYDYSGRRNNMVLAQGAINMQPNQLHAAGSQAAIEQSEHNALARLFVESDQKAGNGQVPFYPDFGRTDIDQNGSTEDYIRIDDSVIGLEGVLSYSYNEYRLIATNQLNSDNFIRNTPRTERPEMNRGDLRIATFNVLNYFNSPFGGDSNLHGGNRGANSYEEFEVQQEKIVNAILLLDADIVGLMEIENNGFGDSGAITQLVDQINLRIPNEKDLYSFVAIDSNQDGETNHLDSIGTDVITTGVIYRDSAVKLKKSRVIAMPSQLAPEVLDDEGKVIEDGKNYQRDSLAPTFKVKGTKEKITVAVNHLKSKGSKCWEDAAPVAEGGQGGIDADKQGSCEQFRVAAAVALGDALEDIKGHKVILGDMNSYGMEDPMLILTDYSAEKYGKEIKAARNTFINGEQQFGDDGAVISDNYGYINAVAMLHPKSWSYSYNDEVGALDHLLISEGLADKVVDATDWHINGGESTLFDYNDEYKGDLPKYQDHFRSSDHDPAVLELQMGGSFGLISLMSMFGIAVWRRRQ
ncbi:ExeM/NucH family extracellular endonuclease [Vibrio sp. 10N.261.55.A7]|uniref:ExeM/NucH family extracellular endonuclease n=1 Tax=Vibrio sp. 10N.261.55.A7 TaxID=1880851 RepID=UPI000C81875E|nr:ExeM/NucH family extracellular endonuclease [Vibrio sp. 10N.261.55.A7]PMJ89343.1 nuclease [Vibrio sp. 10N.261.55.A7]